jgi:hypothetical protein
MKTSSMPIFEAEGRSSSAVLLKRSAPRVRQAAPKAERSHQVNHFAAGHEYSGLAIH